jgi:hypothetical protein
LVTQSPYDTLDLQFELLQCEQCAHALEGHLLALLQRRAASPQQATVARIVEVKERLHEMRQRASAAQALLRLVSPPETC